eukprot:164246_1
MNVFFNWLIATLTLVKSQYLSLGTIPYGCGPFQFYNSSLNANNPPLIIQNALSEIEEFLDYLFTTSGTPSLSYGIVYDQQLIYYKSYGVTNLKTLNKPNIDSIYRIGSISKVFTVLMSYIMRDKNQISFDDPIYKFNNKFSIQNPWGITNEEKLGHTLTIKQLASQISGLPREAPCIFEGKDCINITTTEIFNRLSEEYLIHPTDTQASYSNLAFAILGNVLSEYNSDISYNQTIFDLVINPLGLTNTGLYLNSNQQKYAATGYNASYIDQGYIDIGWVGPAGQLFSSVNDLSILMKQYFAAYPSLYQQEINDKYNFITSPQTLREMLRSVFINPDEKSGFGSPWEMQMLDKHFIRGKGGNINGFSSEIDMIPEMKLGVIALSNYDMDESMFTLSTLEILLPAFKEWLNSVKVSEFKPNLPNNINDYVGTYFLTETIPLFKVYIDNRTKYLMVSSSLNGFYGVLTWISKQQFVYNEYYDNTESCWQKTLGGSPGITIEFTSDTKGSVNGVMINDLDYGIMFPKGHNVFNESISKKYWYFKQKQKHCKSKWKKNKSKVMLGARYL